MFDGSGLCRRFRALQRQQCIFDTLVVWLEQLDLVIATIRLGHHVNPGCRTPVKWELLRRVSEALKQPEEYVEKMLRMFSLEPRTDFLNQRCSS